MNPVQTGTTVVARGLIRRGARCGRHGRVTTRHLGTLRWDSLTPLEVRMEVTPREGGPMATETWLVELLDSPGHVHFVELRRDDTLWLLPRDLVTAFLSAIAQVPPADTDLSLDDLAALAVTT